jgi:hypothetical protein
VEPLQAEVLAHLTGLLERARLSAASAIAVSFTM